LFRTLVSGEYTISGFSNRRLRLHLRPLTSGQTTRLLTRLRIHGIIKRVGKRYRYYLTDFGRHAAIQALKLRELVVIPALASA